MKYCVCVETEKEIRDELNDNMISTLKFLNKVDMEQFFITEEATS